MSKFAQALETLPPDKVVMRGGQVVEKEEWCCWNGENACTEHITRHSDGRITCMIGDPEHGGRTVTGATIEEALDGRYHPNIRGPIIEAFTRTDLTEADLQRLFPRHTIAVC